MEKDAPQQLFIRCAMCRRTFSSGIFVGKESLEAVPVSARVHECPHCGFTTAYSGDDYLVQDK